MGWGLFAPIKLRYIILNVMFFSIYMYFFEIQMDVNLPLRPVSTLVRSPNVRVLQAFALSKYLHKF